LENHDIAYQQITTSKLWGLYRKKAMEDWTVFLTPTSTRGQWSGQLPFVVEKSHNSGPLAALTRATIKPRTAFQFWSRVPDISEVIGSNSNVIFKIGIGEVPLLHQVTFSIWPDADTMTKFARDTNGPHQCAINAVRQGNWFSEELYTRFIVTGDLGTWGGQSPLKNWMPAI